VQAFLIATGRSGWVRPAVEKRDQGVCALCGLDTEQKPRIAALVARLMTREWSPGFTYQGQFCQGYWKSDYKTELTVRRRIGEHWGIRWSDHLWEADHIVPVAEGGGGCGLENYRTLCIPCHRKVTRELAGRLKLSREKVRRLERLFR
jgi:5-methylcytosine-specific restriction endonuclease McrA